jgi:hypothetical protein
VVDGEGAGTIGLWGTGGRDNWCWDRTSLALGRGRHAIRLHPDGEFDVDHLNVIGLEGASGLTRPADAR